MYVVEFYVNDEFKKTAKLICDSYKIHDNCLQAFKVFNYPSFLKEVTYCFSRDYIKTIRQLKKG